MNADRRGSEQNGSQGQFVCYFLSYLRESALIPANKLQAKISSSWAVPASKRFDKGVRHESNAIFEHARFSPSASSEADLNTRNDLRG